jgi:predicted PurR-regulated permease PerM
MPDQPTFSFFRTPQFFWAVTIVLFVLFLAQVSSILLPFVLGLMLAYCFDPLADRLEMMKIGRTSATAFITICLFTFLIGGLFWLMPLLAKQLLQLLELLPQLLSRLMVLVRDISAELTGTAAGDVAKNLAQTSPKEALNGLSKEILGTGGNILQHLLSSGAAMLNTLSLLFITPIVSFYALRDWDRMVAQVDGLLPCDAAPTIREQCREIDQTLSAFLRGQLNVMLILAAYYGIALSIAGAPFAILLGLLSAVLILVPYVGTMVSMVLGLGAVWIEQGLGTTFYATLGIYFVGQILEQQVLTPTIIGNRVGLHPLWMLFGMLSGAALFGFVGVLLAVPIAAVIGVLVRFAVGRYRESRYYLGDSAA